MTTLEAFEEILSKHSYRLVKVTRFKNCDRVKVEAKFGFLTVNYLKHLEDFTLEEACEGLLSREQFISEFKHEKSCSRKALERRGETLDE